MFKRTLASLLFMLATTPEAYAAGWYNKVTNVKCTMGVATSGEWTYSDPVSKPSPGNVTPDFGGEFTVGHEAYTWEVVFRNDQANTFVKNKATNERVALASISIPRGQFPDAGVVMQTLSIAPGFEEVKASCSKFESYQ